MRQDWTLIRKIKHGHAYWKRIDSGAIAISDESGTYPENCERADRPPLLLDQSAPVVISTQGCSVPLVNAAGETVSTPASGFEALWVAVQFGLQVEAIEHTGAKPLRCTLKEIKP